MNPIIIPILLIKELKHKEVEECERVTSRWCQHDGKKGRNLVKWMWNLFFILIQGHFLIAFREREEGRERNISAREQHWLVASCRHLDQGLNLQPRYAPSLEIEPTTLGLCDDAPTNWAIPARAYNLSFTNICILSVCSLDPWTCRYSQHPGFQFPTELTPCLFTLPQWLLS